MFIVNRLGGCRHVVTVIRGRQISREANYLHRAVRRRHDHAACGSLGRNRSRNQLRFRRRRDSAADLTVLNMLAFGQRDVAQGAWREQIFNLKPVFRQPVFMGILQ